MSGPVTKERLQKYIRLRQEIENQIERLARIESSLTSPNGMKTDGMPHSNFAVDRMAVGVIRKQELEEAIDEALRKEKQEFRELEIAVQKLDEPNERQVIRMRYFDGFQWSEICECLYHNKDDYEERKESYERKTYKLHGTALSRLLQLTREKKAGKDMKEHERAVLQDITK